MGAKGCEISIEARFNAIYTRETKISRISKPISRDSLGTVVPLSYHICPSKDENTRPFGALENMDQGTISRTLFSSYFKFDGNFILFSYEMKWSIAIKFCYDTLQWGYAKTNCPSNLNYDDKIVR